MSSRSSISALIQVIEDWSRALDQDLQELVGLHIKTLHTVPMSYPNTGDRRPGVEPGIKISKAVGLHVITLIYLSPNTGDRRLE